ncbi:hypothetical protein [Neptunomonas japonica]|uniref:Uncharacterized protein n=1 Tax=Neptunomonas japonica JAMM 1380 TaxID=1441457 RepID=A0A7R6PEY0_9GAMM|nr:hypothetical protein [Neptunomonas japonica]BBB31299.1 hypothetical protein NEJAP_3361 [Neptunomonas japonica JAMM 1380]
MKITQLFIGMVLALVISFVPQLSLAKDKLKSGVVYQSQGVLQEIVTKGTGSIMIDNEIYKVASHARIREAGNPTKLRHLDLGLDVLFSYKKGKKGARRPVITSINVIMK